LAGIKEAGLQRVWRVRTAVVVVDKAIRAELAFFGAVFFLTEHVGPAMLV
jgi:hypothetical protein